VKNAQAQGNPFFRTSDLRSGFWFHAPDFNSRFWVLCFAGPRLEPIIAVDVQEEGRKCSGNASVCTYQNQEALMCNSDGKNVARARVCAQNANQSELGDALAIWRTG
jgi:hypothetical protein